MHSPAEIASVPYVVITTSRQRRAGNGLAARLVGAFAPRSIRTLTSNAMRANRSIASIAGVLFITATATVLLATAIEQPVLNAAGWLGNMPQDATRLLAGGLLEFIAAGTSVAIAISMYPLLRHWSVGLALGAVVFRALEALMYTVGAVSLLSVVAVGRQFASASAADRGSLQAVADGLLAMRQEAILAGVFAFCVGAFLYYAVLFRSDQIPLWLSGWGIGGVVLMLVACVLALFTQSPVTSQTILTIPIAVQEMVLAVWLIACGLSASPRDSEQPARVSTVDHPIAERDRSDVL
jgi:hypothetical protein